MSIKFKNTLKGERVTLKQTKPAIKMAQTMFSLIDSDREHLGEFLSWVNLTKKVEDSMRYLFRKEEETKLGKKIEYGIWVSSQYVGNIAMFDIRENAHSGEIGYWVASKFGGKGYATEAVRVLEKDFFTRLNFHRIVIKCQEDNLASAKVAQKCGYVFEGKHREDRFIPGVGFKSTLYFAKLQKEYSS